MQEDVVKQLGQPAPEASSHRTYNGERGAACRLPSGPSFK